MKVTWGNIEVQPGQYWEIDGTRYMIVGINPHDEDWPVVVTDEDGDIENYLGDRFGDDDNALYLPFCESFDYEKPDPGDGYTLLNNAIDKPQPGDEWLTLCSEQWLSASGHEQLSEDHWYRRKIASPQPDPGDDWRLIDPAVDKPEYGDEFWNIYVNPRSWQQRSSCIYDFSCGTTYRRRLPQAATPKPADTSPNKKWRDQLRNDKPVQPGYRYLEDGEVIEHGDEFCSACTWYECTDTVGTKYADESLTISIIRRKLPEPAAVNYPQYWTLGSNPRMTAYMVKYTADSPVMAILRTGESIEITKGETLSWWMPITADEALERFRSMVHTTDEAPNCAAEVPQTPPVQYRILEQCETVKDGDEVSLENLWHKSECSACGKVSNFNLTKVRRPIRLTSDPQYRYLDDEETVQKGDEIGEKSCKYWISVCTSVGKTVKSCDPDYVYRRKVQQ